MPRAQGRGRRPGRPDADGREEHRDWSSLVEIDGPFLTLPVLLRVWPTLDAVDAEIMRGLREVHEYADRKPRAWIEYVVEELLDWHGLVSWDPVGLGWTAPEYGVTLAPTFACLRAEPPLGPLGPAQVHLLGYVLDPDVDPRGRAAGDEWPARWTERVARACRALGVPFALVTNGRIWSLVAVGAVTTTVTFDTVTWAESADRVVVRAFRSFLRRSRFTAVAPEDQLVALLAESALAQEELTEALGIQVRRAVEQLVEAMGRWDAREGALGRAGLADLEPAEVYRGAVNVLMRLMFLFFAEERRLLPADAEVYAEGYSASTLADRLETVTAEAGEEALEHRVTAWPQLLATAAAVHGGVTTPGLRLPAYDGSLFDPNAHPWLTRVQLDDRTLLHVLQAVQYVTVRRERRRVSFRTLEVEQIGYVYEGLLAFDAVRSPQLVLGLIGKAGLEEEVSLPELESLIATATDLERGTLDVDGLAGVIAERYKASGIGSAKRLATLLAPADAATRTQRLQRLLAVTDGDRAVAERILPLYGLLRPDLRGLPTVIPARSLYVTASSARAKSGTHYTPRKLAEQVTETALLPLLYGTPGPLQTEDSSRWPPAGSAYLLALKVADLAMGSGAFLVAACRYLAGALVAAWDREGALTPGEVAAEQARDGDQVHADGELTPATVRARRAVIEHCLYGVDVNPMAVEMAKLSLWLVSMDPEKPFTFLDAHLRAGDSLLGVSSLDQLEALHVLPARGRALHHKFVRDPTTGIRGVLADLADRRRAISRMPGETLAQLDAKRAELDAADHYTWRTELMADLVAGSGLQAAKGVRQLDDASKTVAVHAEALGGRIREASEVVAARERANAWLATDLPDGADPRRPLHWPLAFPEVWADRGGFDAIIGNPPFLGGQKLTGTMGTAYRDYLLHVLGRGRRGSADLVAYFVLRAHQLLNDRGQTGLIATNTLAQGDTREVALDQLVDDGVTIKAAIKSEPWPARSAVLEYCAVWTSAAAVEVQAVLDGSPMRVITTSLDPGSRVGGKAHRLAENSGICFQGSVVLGMGFTMSPERAQQLVAADPRNAEVLFPYLSGEDLNTRPHNSASRWVINFHDWSEERARSYAAPFAQVQDTVRVERQKNNREVYRRYWWRYGERRPALQAAIADLTRLMVITLHSKAVMPLLVSSHNVFSHGLAVFASAHTAMLALLSSASHYWWSVERGSTLETRIRYTPTDVFETFPWPFLGSRLETLGHRLDTERRDFMLSRELGLTATYNLVHNPDCADAGVVNLREIHREIDHAVFASYGWTDLEPVHDHFPTRLGIRWTIDPATRQEMLDRLLELNHERYAAEQGQSVPAESPEGLF